MDIEEEEIEEEEDIDEFVMDSDLVCINDLLGVFLESEICQHLLKIFSKFKQFFKINTIFIYTGCHHDTWSLGFNLWFFSVYQNSVIKNNENQVLRIFENGLFMARKSEVSEL